MQTLKLHTSWCNIHHWGRVTPFQRLKSIIPLQKVFRTTILVSLEAVITTCALILILTFQRCTDIEMCKKLFRSPHMLNFHFQLFLYTFHFFSFWGHTNNNEHKTVSTLYKNTVFRHNSSPTVSLAEHNSIAKFQPASTRLLLARSFLGLRAGVQSRTEKFSRFCAKPLTELINGNTNNFIRLGQIRNKMYMPMNINTVARIIIGFQWPIS